jgi:hypothetical protein
MKIFIYMKNKSIAVNTDYMMVMHNPVLDEYEYYTYHILDISELNGEKHVNIQYTDAGGRLSRHILSHEKFLKLRVMKILTPIR